MSIHPTAIIAPGAKLHKTVQVGPYCTVGENVTIGAGTILVGHVAITGHTTLGENNTVYPFASLGQPSPDRKYKGEKTTLIIGNGNDIREYVTMHIGTAADKGKTTVGSDNLFMAGSHVAHDCVVGSRCTIANYVQLAGHVVLEDDVTIGGLSGIAQHLRIGRHAIIGGHSAVSQDVPPFGNVSGRKAQLKGLNLIGLRRRGFDRMLIQAIDEAYDYLFDADDLPLNQRATQLKKRSKLSEVKELADFVLTSNRGIATYEDDE
ncbi:MAG TPA: acyl-ACP--UDP-N-acetylglucosamine O-acyltransferase [Alphaproteobacteria bacterium]|nr:acyl-ACP--UDP-N-acetylglucosamine O-acyltransferase [Alphaproteobacteria bacterium]